MFFQNAGCPRGREVLERGGLGEGGLPKGLCTKNGQTKMFPMANFVFSHYGQSGPVGRGSKRGYPLSCYGVRPFQYFPARGDMFEDCFDGGHRAPIGTILGANTCHGRCRQVSEKVLAGVGRCHKELRQVLGQV